LGGRERGREEGKKGRERARGRWGESRGGIAEGPTTTSSDVLSTKGRKVRIRGPEE